MLNQGLIDRSRRYISKGKRLWQVFRRGFKGLNVNVAVVGGSISKGQPFVQKGKGKRVYFHVLEDWWNKVVQPVTGSRMKMKDFAIGGIGSDYYANCLSTHLPKESDVNLVLWELSGNDFKRYTYQKIPPTQPLEQFVRNTLQYQSHPEVILLNFFNGDNFKSQRKCLDLDQQGERNISKHYDVTELSWTTAVCPFLQRDESGLAMKYLFSADGIHPSIPAHAQMAYILIDHIRDKFVKALSSKYFEKAVIPRAVLPLPLFKETYTGTPLCYTFIKVGRQASLNTLPLEVISSPSYKLATYRSFIHRQDILSGIETLRPNDLIRLRFNLPSYAAVKPFQRLSVLSFTKSGSALAQLDNRKVVPLRTNNFYNRGTIATVTANRIGPGEHELKIWSKEGGFLILALMLG